MNKEEKDKIINEILKIPLTLKTEKVCKICGKEFVGIKEICEDKECFLEFQFRRIEKRKIMGIQFDYNGTGKRSLVLDTYTDQDEIDLHESAKKENEVDITESKVVIDEHNWELGWQDSGSIHPGFGGSSNISGGYITECSKCGIELDDSVKKRIIKCSGIPGIYKTSEPEETYNIHYALDKLFAGKKVKRTSWGKDNNFTTKSYKYIKLSDDKKYFIIRNEPRPDFGWEKEWDKDVPCLYLDDLMAEDWIEVKE